MWSILPVAEIIADGESSITDDHGVSATKYLYSMSVFPPSLSEAFLRLSKCKMRKGKSMKLLCLVRQLVLCGR